MHNDDGDVVAEASRCPGRQVETFGQTRVLLFGSAGAAADGVPDQVRGAVLVERFFEMTFFANGKTVSDLKINKKEAMITQPTPINQPRPDSCPDVVEIA